MDTVSHVHLIIVIAVIILLGCKVQTDDIATDRSVSELKSLEIGGMKQWILIRGNDCSNPVLLWLHGGPGAAQMPVHHAYNRALENEFIVVHWDQRGAGKSNHKGFREETMTLEQFIEDTHELTQYLKERFEREKIFLLGHSWGTQLGIFTVQHYPGDYHAYISVAQVVHPARADSVSWHWLNKQVEVNSSNRQKRKFTNLGLPPFDEHDRYVSFAKMKDSFGGGMDVSFGRLAWVSLRAKEYTIGDYVKWLRGANRGSGPMWEETRNVDLFRDVPELEVPAWFIAGANDFNTPAELIQDYVETLNATAGKELIIMNGTAHTPFIGDPEQFHQIISGIKLDYFNRIKQ
ncbi:MAG: alpha/beta hydrolase [Balneolaceae bacterium]|nr:MAG: alpha/beta hydrolase [Balneolaceae bacterium]